MIPNSWTKNRVLTHFLATLTQFLARLWREISIRGENFWIFCVQLFRAGLWVNFRFGQRYASEKSRTNIPIKPNELAILCLLTTSGAYSLLAMIQQIGDGRNLSEKIVQWEGVALPAESSTPLKRRIFWRNLYWARRS